MGEYSVEAELRKERNEAWEFMKILREERDEAWGWMKTLREERDEARAKLDSLSVDYREAIANEEVQKDLRLRAEEERDVLRKERDALRERADRLWQELQIYERLAQKYRHDLASLMESRKPSQKIMGARFAVGQQVEKYTGDYQLPGEVRAAFKTRAGNVRYVVEHEPGFLHIYSEKNLREIRNDQE